MSEPVRLHPADLELLARLMAQELAAVLSPDDAQEPSVVGETKPTPEEGALLTAWQVGERMGVTAAWVRENGKDLAVRLGTGPRPDCAGPRTRCRR